MNYYLLVVIESEGTSTQEGPFETAHERDEMAEEMMSDDGNFVLWLDVSSKGILKSGAYGDSENDDEDDDNDEDEDFESLTEDLEEEDEKWV